MPANNQDLHTARTNAADEFYTDYSDIQKEVMPEQHIVYDFENKRVFCPCDDYTKSNFYKFFKDNFKELRLKELIALSYPSEQHVRYDGTQESVIDNNIMYGKFDVLDDGDFAGLLSNKLLQESDVVVTNPPFSKFRQFFTNLLKSGKEFLILGNINAVTYREVFPSIVENKVWLGHSIHSGDRKFYVPDYYPLSGTACGTDEENRRYVRVKGVRWFTNIDYAARHEDIVLYKHYTPEEYPHYDNYDAIEIPFTDAIPSDYDGVMGVPISFLGKYCPEQFEIVNANDYRKTQDVPVKAHGLIKDKEASITTYKDSECKKKLQDYLATSNKTLRERETNNLCTNLYQTYCSLPELTVGMSTDNANMQGYSSVSYLDMVARPIVQGIKLYRRVFIKKKILS